MCFPIPTHSITLTTIDSDRKYAVHCTNIGDNANDICAMTYVQKPFRTLACTLVDKYPFLRDDEGDGQVLGNV